MAWAVDREGRRRGGLFCCTSPFAIDYAYRTSKSVLSALKPDSYWPDDDLRIVNARSVRTLAKDDLAKVFGGAVLTDPEGLAALAKRFPELDFVRKLEIRPLSSERMFSLARRDVGYERFGAIGKCENVKAMLYPKSRDVTALSLTVRKTSDGRTAGVLVLNLGMGVTPPLELALRRGVTRDWAVRLPGGESVRADEVRRGEGESVIRLPPLQAFQPALVAPL